MSQELITPKKWPNGCNETAPAALRYLANNERPTGGQQEYNAEHLFQLADELESAFQRDYSRGEAGTFPESRWRTEIIAALKLGGEHEVLAKGEKTDDENLAASLAITILRMKDKLGKQAEPAPSIEWRPVSDEYDPGSVLFASILRGTLVSTARMSYPEATHYLSFSDLKDIPTAKPKTPRQIAEEEFEKEWDSQFSGKNQKETALEYWLRAKGFKEDQP